LDIEIWQKDLEQRSFCIYDKTQVFALLPSCNVAEYPANFEASIYKHMRISWGYKIFIGYSLFVVGILFLVYKANTQSFDLVTENYYEVELKYQDVIDQKGRTAALSAPPKISHSVNSVSVQLPAEFTTAGVEGQVYLYRPSDAGKDIREAFRTSTGFTEVKLKHDLSGAYELKLSWQSGGKTFFHESRIFF
jgi:hypothetical protein